MSTSSEIHDVYMSGRNLSSLTLVTGEHWQEPMVVKVADDYGVAIQRQNAEQAWGMGDTYYIPWSAIVYMKVFN